METRTVPTPAALAPAAGVYDRDRWEQAVLDSSLQRSERQLALILAHHAGVSGRLPAGGGRQEAGHLAADMRLDAKRVRLAMSALELAGWIRRPDIHTWHPRSAVRPITLAFPADRERSRPPHTGATGA